MTSPAPSFIYLDNNASTQVDPAVLSEMLPFFTEHYANPSTGCLAGRLARQAVETARQRVAALLHCAPDEIVFTSGGTESNHTAIRSALELDPDRRHMVTTRVEHSSVLRHCEALARRGVEVSWVGVDARGRIDLAELERAIRPDTALVTVHWANNETGVLFPIREIAEIVQRKRALLHCDAVQAAGKIPIDLADCPIAMLSISGHKLHAPKGVGALYVSRRVRFTPLLLGGGQENGRRAGTENVASIVGLGKACELAGELLAHGNGMVRRLRDDFEQAVLAAIPGSRINGDRECRLPNTSNLAFDGVPAPSVLTLLDRHGICCSAGSACATGSPHPSHVLKAMGFSDAHARSSLRFSFSRFNSGADVAHVLAVLPGIIEKLRGMLA